MTPLPERPGGSRSSDPVLTGRSGHRRPFGDRGRSSFGGLRPLTDSVEREHDRTRQFAGGGARSQVDPPRGGSDAHVHRQGRWRAQSALRFRGYMGGPASLAFIPLAPALRAGRLNGFPGALAVVPRHRIAGRRRRVSDTSATRSSHAAKAVKPASQQASKPASIHVKRKPFFFVETCLAASLATARLRCPLLPGSIIRERSPRDRGWGRRGWCTLSADALSRCGPAGRACWRGRGASASRPSGRPSAACPGPGAPRTCA